MPAIRQPEALQKRQVTPLTTSSQPPDILNTLSPKQKADLFQQRVQQLAEKNQSIPWDPDAAKWIETHFWIPENRGPMNLHPYQRAALHEALRKDDSGRFVYSTVVWSDIKKSGKSTLAAGVALWRAWGAPWGSVYLVANDLKQADSRVGYYMRRGIELNPVMRNIVKQRNYRLTLPNSAFIESIPIDPSGEAGSNADGVVFSELWGAHQQAQQRMWTEATLPPNKFGLSQRWVETYAGYSGESPLLEQLYEMGVKQGQQLQLPGAPPDLEVYANHAARLFVLWNTQPRLPWQSPDYYASEAAVLAPSEFQRVHRNQWVSSSQTFVPIEWWDACQQNDTRRIRPLAPHRSLVFGVDAGVSSDCFAIVGVERIRGSKKDNTEDQIVVRYAKAWYPPKGGKIDFAEPEAEIQRLYKKYKVLEWAYDQYQLHDMATRLKKRRVGWWNPFNQSATRFVADKNLYDLIREGRILHDGDPMLREHIANANAEVKGEKMRIVKRAEYMKIDLTVALSMAAYEALRLNL